MRRNVLHSTDIFKFESGGQLDGADIVYYTSDREYSKGDTVIWICHALTGNANPEEWWPQMVSSGKLFDPDRYFVVCVSMVCSAYGEFGPATINPKTGKPYLLEFPQTTIRDMISATIMVRRHLGIEKVDLLIGPSIGGYQAIEWAISEPDVIRKAVILATAPRCTPYLTAYNESQRMAILADPTFIQAADIHGGEAGLKCARSIALISYRTFAGYNVSQNEDDDDTLIASKASSYQRYQGEKLVSRGFDAYSYWYLTIALDSMNPGRNRGGLVKALKSIKAECTVISITSDQLFPPEPLKELSEIIENASYHEIRSIYGHDGFLIESDQLEAILKTVLV